MTVIEKARELVAEYGKETAIKFFENRIKLIGQPTCFQDVCNISGNETAIEYINNNF